MFGKLTQTVIEVRNGISYEQKTYNNNGAVSTIERVVTKAMYDTPIANTQAQLTLLQTLQSACAS